MSNTCLYSLIKASADTCTYVKENCNDQTILPFTHYYFCWVDENWVILILIAVNLIPIFSLSFFSYCSTFWLELLTITYHQL